MVDSTNLTDLMDLAVWQEIQANADAVRPPCCVARQLGEVPTEHGN
jgi:hypothetical protein